MIPWACWIDCIQFKGVFFSYFMNDSHFCKGYNCNCVIIIFLLKQSQLKCRRGSTLFQSSIIQFHVNFVPFTWWFLRKMTFFPVFFSWHCLDMWKWILESLWKFDCNSIEFRRFTYFKFIQHKCVGRKYTENRRRSLLHFPKEIIIKPVNEIVVNEIQ